MATDDIIIIDDSRFISNNNSIIDDNESNTSCLSLNDYLALNGDLSTRYATMALFAVCYALIIVAGLIGNCCVILSIGKNRQLQTVPNMFILSLSCSDCVVLCTSATITPITAFSKVWLFGSLLCALMPLISGVSLFFSTFILTAISIDRFILIVLPTRSPIQRQHALMIIGVVVCLAVALSLPIAMHQKVTEFNHYCGTFCSEDWNEIWARKLYGSFSLVLQFLVPLIIITICYSLICVKIANGMLAKRDSAIGGGQLQLLSKQRQSAVRRRQRTNRMLIGMVLAFAASYTPYIVFNLSRDYGLWPSWLERQQFFYGILTHCIAMLSTVWNPVLYAWLNTQLRAAFVALLLGNKSSSAGGGAGAVSTKNHHNHQHHVVIGGGSGRRPTVHDSVQL